MSLASQDTRDLMSVLIDPDAVKQRLKQLQSVEQRANVAVEAARKTVELLRAECSTECAAMVTSAEKDCAATVVTANESKAEARAARVELEKERTAATQEIERMQLLTSEHDARESELNEKAADLGAREQELVEHNTKLARSLSQLSEAAARVQQVVA